MIDNFRTLISGVLAKVSSLYAKKEDVYTKDETYSKCEVDETIDAIPQAIIDVYELPTTNIDRNALYRISQKAAYVGRINGIHGYHYELDDQYTVKCVTEFPKDCDNDPYTIYCNQKDKQVGKFNNDEWEYYNYDKTVIYNVDATVNDTQYILLDTRLYVYRNGWLLVNPAVVDGQGPFSNTFNDPNSDASGIASHAEGSYSHAEGSYSHAEGHSSHSQGRYSHAEGDYSHAEGIASHAEGYFSHAQGRYSHAEGSHSHAEGESSHAEGYSSHAQGRYSHAEGNHSHAEGESSHTEGESSHAEGRASHAEGYASHAGGYASHAEGNHSHAVGWSQHVQGEYNVIDPDYNPDTPNERSKYAHIVGNGTSKARSNAHTLDWSGNAWFQGKVKIGGTGQDDEAAKTLATEEFVTEAIASIPTPDPGSGTASPAIIDVTALPTENIREDCFYRLLTGTFVYNQFAHNNWTCHCVDALPETGEAAMAGELGSEDSVVTAYYNVQDDTVYGYVTEELAQVFGVPAGWYPADVLFSAAGLDYKGAIFDIKNDPNDDAYRVLLDYVNHSYKEGKWTAHATIGWAGTGSSAEIFNHPSNIASGAASHAEGYKSIAEGYYSHAEGHQSCALGDYSHAEGQGSHAEGESSHAEGDSSHAEGRYSHAEGSSSHAEGHYSHAEGFHSHAKGDCSHAEGWATTAVGYAQHVQGVHNREDVDGKYLHIVGNGDDAHLSNAHTLDWNGLGWFAGGLKVGGTSQDDPNAKEIATKDYVDSVASSGGSGGGVSSWNDLNDKPFDISRPEINITWDGDMTGRPAIDMSIVDMAGYYFVKVSDEVPEVEEFIGGTSAANDGQSGVITKDHIEEPIFPGCNTIGGAIAVIYDAAALKSAVGIEDDAITNGIYLLTMPDESFYISHLVVPEKIQHLESKYIKDMYRTIHPKFEITWDGDMTGKFALPGSQIGFGEGIYFVKVSDEAYTYDDLLGAVCERDYTEGDESDADTLDDDLLDADSYPGGIRMGDYGIIIYDSSQINAALGLPDGTISNGVYFTLNQNVAYTSRLAGPETVITIDEKYLPETIATKDYVESLILGAIGGSY